VNFLQELLSPPVFDDEEKTHQAYLLHVILLALIAIPIPFVAFLLIRRPEEANRGLTLISASEIIHIFLFMMLRRGYVRLASVIQVVAIWLLFAATSVTSSSVYGVALYAWQWIGGHHCRNFTGRAWCTGNDSASHCWKAAR
jgi:hypothetical protein